MDKFSKRFIENSQIWRNEKLTSFAQKLIKFKISANLMTLFSLISGLLAIYFLFNNYVLFLLFALLHLLADSLDGVIARLTKPTTFGKYFDGLTDALVTFLAIAKVAYFLADYYALIVAFLFLLNISIYFASGLKAPMILMRSASLIVLMVASFPYFPYPAFLLTLGYLVVGILAVYTLGRQIVWFRSSNKW